MLIEDETLIREILQKILETERGWTNIVGFGDGKAGLDHCVAEPPDLLILDLDLPGMNGWDVANEVRRHAPRTRILMLTANTRARQPAEFMKIGVNGYVNKTAPYPHLLQAIDAVFSGAMFFTAEAPPSARSTPDAGTVDVRAVFNDLELAIAKLVVAGLSSKEIATELDLTTRSVDKHRANMMEKLGVRQVASLVRLCVLAGIT